MGIDYTVTLRNAQEMAAYEQSSQAAAKVEKQLQKNAQQYKGVNKEVESLIRELKIEEQLEQQIEREQKAHASADIQRYRDRAAAAKSAAQEMARASEDASRRMTQAFITGGKGGYSSFPQADPVSAGFSRWSAGQALLNMRPPHLRGLATSGDPMAAFTGAPDFDSRIRKERAIRADIQKTAEAQESAAVSTKQLGRTTSAASIAISDLASNLQGLAAIGGASAAIGAIKQGLEFGHGQRVAGAEAIKGDFQIMREISEVSEAGQAGPRYQKYLELKQQLGSQTAWGLLEKGIATGNEGSVDYFAANRGAMDPAVSMSVGSHLETLFGGQVNEIQGANMVLEASRKSRWTVGEFAPSAATAAVGGSMAGSSAAETLAIMSVMSDVLKNPDEVSQRMQYLGTRGKYMGIKSHDKGLMAMMDELSAMPVEERKDPKYAGERIQILSFVDKMNENRAKIIGREREIELAQEQAGGPKSNLEVGQREFMSLPGAPELLRNQKALGAEEEALRDAFGPKQLTMESVRSEIRASDVNVGRGSGERFVRDTATGIAEGVGADPATAPAAASFASMIFGGGMDHFTRMIGLQAEANAQQAEAIEQLKQINGKTVPASKPAPNPNGGGRR